MRTPTITSKALAGTLAPLAVAGAFLGVGAILADDAEAASREFRVHNYTSQTLTLARIDGNGNFEGRPEIGAAIRPGESQGFNVQYRFGADQTNTAIYRDPSGRDVFNARMKLGMVGGVWSSCWNAAGFGCSPGDGWAPDKTNVYLMDAPNTRITIPGSQGQAQADVLKQICDKGGAACKFTPTREEHVLGAPRPVGQTVVNPGDTEVTTTIRAADKVGESTSLGIEATAGIDKVVEVAVTAKYERQWVREHEFSQDVQVRVPPRSKAWLTHQPPVIRDTGNFTVTLGNTTWYLNDVVFETPDTTKHAQMGAYVVNTASATPPEIAHAEANPLAGQPALGPGQPGAPTPVRRPVKPAGPKVGLKLASVRGRTARVQIACPRSARSACKGTLRLQTTARKARTLGSRGFSIRAGRRGTVTVRLRSAPKPTLIARRPTIRLKATANTRDSASRNRLTNATLRLALPRTGRR